MTREDILADVIRKNLLGVDPGDQWVSLDDDDYRLILELLEVRKGLAVTEPFVARYRNWRGEVSERRLIPLEVWFGSTEWHAEPQWLLRAFDLDKQADRDFALADFHPPEGETIESYYRRQIAWSALTFGPARRTKGVIEHIRRELVEVEADPTDLAEWLDVVVLAMDGYWRHGGTVEALMPALLAKQARNAGRSWPDWRTLSEDDAVEHDRSADVPQPRLLDEGVICDRCGRTWDPAKGERSDCDPCMTAIRDAQAEAVWPIGCIKRSACARHKACVYGNFGSCTHATRSIVEDVEKASEGGR